MDDKGMRNGWTKNPNILEDVFEALVGAIYLDLGMVYAKNFILRIFNDPEIVDLNYIIRKDDNYKDILMRWCQAQKKDLPEYVVDASDNTRFRVLVYVDKTRQGFGVGTTKKEAEQKAAFFALKTLAPRNSNSDHDAPTGSKTHRTRRRRTSSEDARMVPIAPGSPDSQCRSDSVGSQ